MYLVLKYRREQFPNHIKPIWTKYLLLLLRFIALISKITTTKKKKDCKSSHAILFFLFWPRDQTFYLITKQREIKIDSFFFTTPTKWRINK